MLYVLLFLSKNSLFTLTIDDLFKMVSEVPFVMLFLLNKYLFLYSYSIEKLFLLILKLLFL